MELINSHSVLSMQSCSLSCCGFSSAPVLFFKIECPAFDSWLPGRLSASLGQMAAAEVLAAQGQIQLQITPGCPSKPHLRDAEFRRVAVHPAWLWIFPNEVPKAFTCGTYQQTGRASVALVLPFPIASIGLCLNHKHSNMGSKFCLFYFLNTASACGRINPFPFPR